MPDVGLTQKSRRKMHWKPVCLCLVAAMICMVLGTWSPTQGQTTAPASSPVKPTTETKGCRTESCHTNFGERRVIHGPVAQDKCMACHQYNRAQDHSFKLAVKKEALCVSCHVQNHRTVVHKPVADGMCMGCHDPHGSNQRMMLLADPTKDLCARCHKVDEMMKKKAVHGPVATGACIVCHEVHSSWNAKLLVETGSALCKKCHSEILPANQAGRHVHDPVKKDCTTCHSPHATDNKYQLLKPTPELCTSTCHQSLQEKLRVAHLVHGALEQPGGCPTCHAPHTSELPKLQKQSQSKLCLSCHDKPVLAKDGHMLADMAALLKENPSHHGPIREDSCTACHQPHNSEENRLLVKAYPPQFYAAFSVERYTLCFSCHRPELATDKQGVGLTRFRQGDVNLHRVHVYQEKGRTCRACHEVHASRKPFHIRDAVPFGAQGWLLEIRFEQTKTGGTCSPGCHESRSYNREATAASTATPTAPTATENKTP